MTSNGSKRIYVTGRVCGVYSTLRSLAFIKIVPMLVGVPTPPRPPKRNAMKNCRRSLMIKRHHSRWGQINDDGLARIQQQQTNVTLFRNVGSLTPNLFALVSDETRRIWVSTQSWKTVVSSFYYGFYYYEKFQFRVETQPRIETLLETRPYK